jgi:hypothetical protein
MNRELLARLYNEGQRSFQQTNGCRSDLEDLILRDTDFFNSNFKEADLCGVDFTNADLRYTKFNRTTLINVNFTGADLTGANFYGANLDSANFHNTKLQGAKFISARLYNTHLEPQWVIQGPTRSDSYEFLLTNFIGEGVRVKAGCRNFTPKGALEFWENTRGHTPLGQETIAIIHHLLELQRIRGLVGWEPEGPVVSARAEDLGTSPSEREIQTIPY